MEHRITEDQPVFAKGFCFAKIFMIFVIGCIIGTYYEELLYFFKSGHWASRQGVLYGPFNPIYGIGFAGFVLLFGKNVETRPWYLTFLYCCLLGGISEYVLSLIGEKMFHATFWDYSQHFLNIGGRTTIPFMLFWGLGGFLFLKFIYPFLAKWIEKIPYSFARYFYPFLLVFLMLDMLLSYTVLVRQALRKDGKPATTIVTKFYDRVYTDERLAKTFPNIVHDKNILDD